MDKKRDTRKHEKNELRCSAATSTQAPSKRPNRTPTLLNSSCSSSCWAETTIFKKA